MKTQSFPKFLLAAAAVAALSGNQVFAQAQAAAAAGAQAVAQNAATAVARSASNVANPDQLEASPAKSAGLTSRIGRNSDYDHEKPEDVHFSFTPPPTTRRKGHPGDRDIKLSDKQLARLNEIGEALVEFVDTRLRVATNETALINAMNKESDKDVEECAKAFTDAQKEREKAQIAVLDATEKLKEAKLNQEEKQKAFDAKKDELNKLNEKIQSEINNIGKLNASIGELEKKQAQAEKDRLTAASELQKAEGKAVNLTNALNEARSNLSAATNSLARAESEAKDMSAAVKELEAATGKAKELVKAKVGERDAAVAAQDAAAKDVAKAEKDVAKAERALEKANADTEKASAAMAKADGAVAKATDAVAKAKAAVEKADGAVAKAGDEVAKAQKSNAAAEKTVEERKAVKTAADEAVKAAYGEIAAKRGFWKRLFHWWLDDEGKKAIEPLITKQKNANEDLRKAEKDLAQAKETLRQAGKTKNVAEKDARQAKKLAESAQAGLNGAKTEAEEAKSALDEAKKVKEAAEKTLGGKKADLEKAKGVLDEANKTLDAARKSLEKAEKDLTDAKTAQKEAEGKLDGLKDEIAGFKKTAAEAASDIVDFGGKLAAAEKEVEKLTVAKKQADEDAEALRKQVKAVHSATDNEGMANIAHEWEKMKLEKEASAALDALEVAKGKVTEAEKLDTPEKRAALEEAQKAEDEAKANYVRALNRQNRVANDARVEVQRMEKELEATNEMARCNFWNLFREEQQMSAADAPNAEKVTAEKTLDKARAKVEEAKEKAETAAAALVAAKAAATTADKALKDATDAVKEANRAVASAERKASSAAETAAKAAQALAAAEAAAKEAQDQEKAAADIKVAAGKKVDADNAKADADKALAAARSATGAKEAALKSAAEAAKKAQDELAKASVGKEEADGALRIAQRELADAIDAVAVADKDVSGARAETDRAVDVLVRAFDEQVAAARLRKLEAINWSLFDQNKRERIAARKARDEYFKARKAYAAARKELAAQRRRFELKEIPWDAQEYAIARQAYSDARTAFEVAEDNYNKYFSDNNTFQTARLTDAEADACYETEEALRTLHGVQFRGDRRWLARTSVNGEPLLESFLGEMEWQADQVGEHDSEDPLKVKLTPAQAVECAKIAAATVQRRAVYGGFYFAGLEVELKEGVPVCFIDKGRYGPISVLFVDAEGQSLDTGRIYNETNILAKLGSKAGDTNAFDAVREGEAFNFIEFRKNFNALNANPDIAKADAAFKPIDDTHFDYGFETEDEGMGAQRTTRAIAADVKVREEPWPAPLHGVLSIDNFNSMGNPDEMGIEDPDAWMARLTLQRLDLWDLGHAFTLNGNYSLGGSLYGGAASYYIPREEGARSIWHRVSWTLHGGYTDVDQGDVIEGLDVLGTGYYGGIQASARLVDFNESSLDLSLGATWRYVENAVRIEGQEIRLGPNGGDGYTIIPFSAALMYAEKGLDDWRGRNFATFEGIFNLGGSNADELSVFRSAIEDDRYLILRAQFARLNLLWRDSDTFLVPRLLFLRADAQWASTPVIGAEQYGLGGHGTVRGYVERQFMGDNGASGTVEFRTPIGLGYLDRSSRNKDGTEKTAYTAADRLQLVYFADFGYFMLQDGAANEQGQREDDSEFLYSVGLGLRYSYKDLVFRFDWGVPLYTTDIETSSGGVGHLSLQYQF